MPTPPVTNPAALRHDYTHRPEKAMFAEPEALRRDQLAELIEYKHMQERARLDAFRASVLEGIASFNGDCDRLASRRLDTIRYFAELL
jgi:hypothetical protein